MRTLRSMVGEVIVARIPALDETDLVLVRLHAIDTHGLWVEHQAFTNRMMRQFRMASSKTTLVLFVPFHAVSFIVSSAPLLSLSEEAFGIQDDS